MKEQHPVKLIVGLGNPGAEYAETRHNAGAWFAEAVTRRFGSSPLSAESKFFGQIAQATIANRSVRVLVPATFMNESGRSVAAIANFYKIEPESILVAHDELDIAPGTIRLKQGGGHGGHNGLRDIIASLGNQKHFGRLRIGIGHPGNAKQVSNYVLKRPSGEEHGKIESSIDAAMQHIEKIIAGEWQEAMNQLHGFVAE